MPVIERPWPLAFEDRLCAGGCGRIVVPVQADDCGQQGGPWYCGECFVREEAERRAR